MALGAMGKLSLPVPSHTQAMNQDTGPSLTVGVQPIPGRVAWIPTRRDLSVLLGSMGQCSMPALRLALRLGMAPDARLNQV